MFKLIYWIEGITTKKWALVSLDLDKRVKSCACLKNRDYSVNKVFTSRSLAEITEKEKGLSSERWLQKPIRRKLFATEAYTTKIVHYKG